MSSEAVHRRVWNNYCPSGVSYTDHIRSLEIVALTLYYAVGATGVFLTHPMLISLLMSRLLSFTLAGSEWCGPGAAPSKMGLLGGIPVWATMDVPENEILIVSDPTSLQPVSQIKLENFVDVKGPLDRLAQIR